MSNFNTTPTLVITSLKLSKDDEGSTIDPTLFKRLVGILMYLTATRPDIMYGVSLISRFMESLKDSHWKAGKIILMYVSSKKDLGIMYSTSENFIHIEYTDSDNGGITNDRKNTYGYRFHFGIGVVSWDSKKQSSAEAEYVTTTCILCQVVWMRRIFKDLLQNQQEPTTIFRDNNSTITLSKNHVFHKRTKHIDRRFHFIRELVNNKEICLEFCKSEDQLADIFTKPLARYTF